METNTNNNSVKLNVKTISAPSKVMEKSNGSKYVLYNLEILEGPFKGESIAGAYTILNAEGEKKETLEKGVECVVYGTQGIDKDGNPIVYWEIANGFNTMAMDKQLDMFAILQGQAV